MKLSKDKEKFVRLDKVRQNQDAVNRDKEQKVAEILKRSQKKEKYALNFMKTVNMINKEIKEKRDARRNQALEKVKMDVRQHHNQGMELYKRQLVDISERRNNRMKYDRA